MYNFDVVRVTSQTIRLFYYFIYYYVYRCTLGENIEKKSKSIFFSREEFKAEVLHDTVQRVTRFYSKKCIQSVASIFVRETFVVALNE